MKKLLLALALFLIPAAASAQCNGIFPNNTICGNATGSPNTARPTPNNVLTGVPGGTNGQIQYNNAGNFGGLTTLNNSYLTPGSANTMKGSLNGTTTSDIALTACTLTYQITKWVAGTGWQCGINPVLPSRAIAATLDLSAFTTITTQGYTTPGDGGEATFLNISSTAFTDAKVLTGAITTGGTCTNGTYLGIPFSGGTGTGLTATVTVAGGVMSAVAIHGTGGQGYTVGNILTASTSAGGGTASITCTVSPTWTVSTVSTPTGSFTDIAANHLQIIRPPAGIDLRAFGYIADWTFAGGDAPATDNYTPLVNALNFASTWSLSIPDNGGTRGGVVLLPKFAGKFCGAGLVPLMIPEGVELRGQGEFSSVIKPCDSWNSNINWIELCDSTTHYSCFAAKMTHMQLYVSVNQDTGSSTAGVTAIYSNNIQDTVILDHVKIYSGACRRGIWLETGYGGTTYNTLMNVGVFGGKGSASCGGTGNSQLFINYGTTQVRLIDFSVGGLSASFSGPRDNGITINGGFVMIEGYHPEQIINPITVNIAGGLPNGMVSATNITGGVDCVGLVTLSSTNTPGNFILRPPMAVNGCTRMVTNAQPAGANLAAAVKIDTIFNP